MDWYLDSTAVMGDTLHWVATYDCPPLVDACPYNNELIRDVLIIEGPVRISDNSIELSSMQPSGPMPTNIENTDTVLSYVIDFRNNSDIGILNLTIIDTLPDELNISSISYPISSHPYSFTIMEPIILIWEFENVYLPTRDVDQLSSYGFIQFNVHLNSGLQEGTIIENKAYLHYSQSDIVSNTVIHVIGGQLPMAICQPEIVSYLDNNGDTEITVDMINNGSFDDNSIEDFTLDIETFDCNNIGTNTVTLTITDDDDNESTCNSIVNVQDTLPPNLECTDYTVVLTDIPEIEIYQSDVVEVADNCTLDQVVIDKTVFSYFDEGDNTVTISATDTEGNQSTCTVNVSVEIFTSTIELINGATISVAPNPFKEFMVLKIEQVQIQNYSIRMMNVSGQEVRVYESVINGELIIEKGSLQSGIYFLNVYEKEGVEKIGNFKLVIQ